MKPFRISDNTIFARFVRVTLGIITIVTLLSLITIIILRVSYDRILYEKNVEFLGLAAAIIEKEIDNLEDLTFTIATDKNIQTLLTTISDEVSMLRTVQSRQDLVSSLLRYDPWELYIKSLRIFDVTGTEIISGRDPNNYSDDVKLSIAETSLSRHGGVKISLPGEINESMIISRQILSTENLTLQNLGTICLSIDFSALIKSIERLIKGYEISIHVFDKNRMIGTTNESLLFDNQFIPFYDSRGYRTIAIKGQRYFTSYVQSTQTQWTYFSVIPISFIHDRLLVLTISGLAVYILMITGLLYFTLRFTRRLTVPIQSLSKMMKKVENGDFNIMHSNEEFSNASDEVVSLHKDFDIAMKKIHELIQEGYLKKIQIQDARFRILQTQINPHFLYNTLDSINWMAAAEGKEDISIMVKSLARLLRRSISSKEKLIDLGQEISLLNDYLSIQLIRFEDKLKISIDIDKSLFNTPVPPFLFQPLVENSIRYAIEDGTGFCSICITGTKIHDRIRFLLIDNGPGFSKPVLTAFKKGNEIPVQGSGIGLTNIKERIHSLFIDGTMDICNRKGGGAEIMIDIPILPGTEN